jgi:transposase
VASVHSVWKRLLGVERGVVVEDWQYEEGGRAFVVSVRPSRKARRRCAECGRRCPLYDRGPGRRRWRGLDLGTTRVFLDAATPRVRCPQHGVHVAAVPWARAHSGFTRQFEQQAAWLAVHTSRTAVSQLLRVAWRTVGRIVQTVGEEARSQVDLLSGLRRIGIDELSHRKGQKYVTVVVDHDTGRLVWMAPGRDANTVRGFFDALGAERTKALQLVSADGASWIEEAVREKAPHVVRCLDTFHVVQWATQALDEVRRDVWNSLRRAGDGKAALHLKGARWALWKNPENLSARQRKTLAWVQEANAPLYRAYLLKEGLRGVFKARSPAAASDRLDAWLSWASRSRLKSFVKLARSIRRYRERIEATLQHGLTNAIVESRNTQLRLLTRVAHGFHHVQAFIGLAMLKLAGLCPPLPGRQAPTAMS